MVKKRWILQLLYASSAVLLSSCSNPANTVTATLYRNTEEHLQSRVRVATFSAHQAYGYNIANCQMIAQLLNADLRAKANKSADWPLDQVGFWCEPGLFKEKGPVPAGFRSQFPVIPHF